MIVAGGLPVFPGAVIRQRRSPLAPPASANGQASVQRRFAAKKTAAL